MKQIFIWLKLYLLLLLLLCVANNCRLHIYYNCKKLYENKTQHFCCLLCVYIIFWFLSKFFGTIVFNIPSFPLVLLFSFHISFGLERKNNLCSKYVAILRKDRHNNIHADVMRWNNIHLIKKNKKGEII